MALWKLSRKAPVQFILFWKLSGKIHFLVLLYTHNWKRTYVSGFSLLHAYILTFLRFQINNGFRDSREDFLHQWLFIIKIIKLERYFEWGQAIRNNNGCYICYSKSLHSRKSFVLRELSFARMPSRQYCLKVNKVHSCNWWPELVNCGQWQPWGVVTQYGMTQILGHPKLL